MKILILNGNPKSDYKKFEEYVEKLSSELAKVGNEVVVLNLNEMKINYCIGCYSCWLKTPGKCIFNDDGPRILTEYLDSDIVLFASPVIMGFVSSLIKSVQERLLPTVHPFLCIKENRMQHIPRYDKYPFTALLLDQAEESDPISSEIIDKIFRSSRSGKFLFTKTMDNSPEEVAYAINNI